MFLTKKQQCKLEDIHSYKHFSWKDDEGSQELWSQMTHRCTTTDIVKSKETRNNLFISLYLQGIDFGVLNTFFVQFQSCVDLF